MEKNKELEKLNKDVMQLIKNYNSIAKKENVPSRIALAVSEPEFYDEPEPKTTKEFEKALEDQWPPYVGLITDKNSAAWFPSDVNC